MRSMQGRIRAHVSEEFDEETETGKPFLTYLRSADGWVEIDRATEIRVNGRSELRMTAPALKQNAPDEWAKVELGVCPQFG